MFVGGIDPSLDVAPHTYIRSSFFRLRKISGNIFRILVGRRRTGAGARQRETYGKLAEQWRICNSERQRRTHYRFVIRREGSGACGRDVRRDSFGSSMCSNASFLSHDGVYSPDL
jgi:hypothetical protein